MAAAWDLDRRRTDAANAERFVVLFGEDVRYCPNLGWFLWDGKRWKKDELGDIDELARLVAESWRADVEALRAASKFGEMLMGERIVDLEKFANACESASKLRSIVKLAETALEVAISPNQLDARPWLLPVMNGTIDLRTGTLRARFSFRSHDVHRAGRLHTGGTVTAVGGVPGPRRRR